MKFPSTVLIFSLSVFFFCSCESGNEDFIGYDKTVTEQFENFNITYLEYIKSLNSGDAKDILVKKNNTLHQIERSIKNLNSIIEIDSDENYLKTSLNYFSILEKSINFSDSIYLLILSKGSGMTTEDSIKIDRKSTRLNSSHSQQSRMPSSA